MKASMLKMTTAGLAIAIVVAIIANFVGNLLVRVDPMMAAAAPQKEQTAEPKKEPVKEPEKMPKKMTEKMPEKPMAKAEPAPAPAPAPVPAKAPAPAPAKMEGVLAMLASADIAKGKKAFGKCKSCHTTKKGDKNRVGPNLWDIVGRAKAGASGFRFSGALKGLGGNWTYQDLDGFLAAPKSFAKGTKMSFSGVKKDDDRAALIVYLRSLSDQPKPLP
ncbi:MAG: cytochrome c family protein [Rhodospirillales bacterium]|nr:cytochrome c family protein [Rhodospirillales bacterium]